MSGAATATNDLAADIGMFLVVGWMAFWIVFIIHCNIWWYGLTKEQRREHLDRDYDLFW